MHGSRGEKWKQRRHMWPVLPNATTVAAAADCSTSEFVCKDGRKICVGDCALFKPPQDSLPFIGIIRKLTLNKEGSPSLGVNRLFRPVDLKLAKGILLDAAPNEVFYSFHKDETPATSLLHPCKVAFLCRGVELPSGISAFVCRRVYDIENKCLWWLTDKDYINERQEEVDQLLDKTRLEMHGNVQSGGRSPKPLNGSSTTPSLKSGSDNSVQNSSFIGSQVKGKKRERGDQGSDSSKRERVAKADDGDSGHFRLGNMLKSEISKITDRDGLVNFEGVERLVKLMQPDSADKKIDLAERIMLVDVLAVTDRFDCLGWFVQLRGLPVLDEWLQEVHKGKIGDGSTPKESDKSVEEFLLALLRALDKLPVNLHALQTCNVGKSVNHLRTHKNSEIQRKARSLVDTWKRRVEAEMNLNDAKSGWPAKPAHSEVSLAGNRKAGGAIEIAAKNSTMQTSLSKNSQSKLNSGEALSKASPSPNSSKSVTPSVGTNSKDQEFKISMGAGTSDLPSIKEVRSSISSQSQNNSLSCREDGRSSTCISLNPMKIPIISSQSQCNSISLSPMRIPGSSSRHQKSSNGLHCSSVNAVPKDLCSGKNSGRNSPSGKVSPTQASHEKLSDTPFNDHGNNQRLIVRLPNSNRSPSSGASGVSFEDHAIPCGKASPSGDKPDNQDKRMKVNTDSLQSNDALNMSTDVCDASEALTAYEESDGSPMDDEQCQVNNNDGDKMAETSKPGSSSPGFVSRLGKTYDASLSSINALIESCVKFSEAVGASIAPGDDVGMKLLATVAAGEISRSENVSPMASPERNSLMAEELCAGIDRKSEHTGEAVACSVGQSDVLAAGENLNTADALQFMNDTKCSVTSMSCNTSQDGDVVSTSCTEKTDDGRTLLSAPSVDLLQHVECPSRRPDMKGDLPQMLLSQKTEVMADPERVHQVHEQMESEIHSKLKARGSTDNDSMLFLEGSCATVKIEKDGKSLESSSDVDNVNQVMVEKVTDTSIPVQKPSTLAESCELKEGTDKNVSLPGASSDAVKESKPENVDDMKACEMEHNEGRVDPVLSITAEINESAEGNSDGKDVLRHYSGLSVRSESLSVPMQEDELQKKSSGCNLDQGESEKGAGDQHAPSVNASHAAVGSDTDVKLDFDLNEGIPVDDVTQAENVRLEEPTTSFAVHMPSPLPFPHSSMSAGFHVSVTVASAAKGPVVLPENPLSSKGKLGWKGSAATSAFRPAEPRKSVEQPSNTSELPSADTTATKQGRPPLDFDLNVPDQRSLEDVASIGSLGKTCLTSGPHDHGNAGLDLDLNRVDETPDAGSFSISKLDMPPLPNKPSSSGGLSNGGSLSRDFDLNGPGLDEVGPEIPAHSQQIKSSVPFLSTAYGVRPSNTEFGNHSSWFASGNSFSAITAAPPLPGRGDQNFVAGAGAHRILGPSGSIAFGPEIFRGPVLSSSPAVAYPPTTPFQYPFPFETNFPLPSNSFSGSSTPFMDSSSAGGLCFPTVPSQLLGPGSVVQSTYSPRPFIMSLQGGTSNVIPESKKWGSQSLDLNSGPGGADSERRDDRLPSGLRLLPAPNSQALMEEQMKMYQAAGVLKRKESDGGWDGADRFSYKQLSWQ